MNWLNKLEQKYGRYAILGLPKIIIALYAAGFLISIVAPNAYGYFELNPYLILHGQVWRLFTFLMIAPTTNFIFVVFVLMFYYSIATSLEMVWGSFRFMMYYLIGVVGTIIGAFLTYGILYATGDVSAVMVQMDTFYLNLSLFLAYAMIFPDREVLFYMIIPLKIKWLAVLDALLLTYTFLSSGFTVYGISVKVSIIVALLNFLLFFLSSRKSKKRGRDFQKAMAKGKKAQKQAKHSHSYATKNNGAIHECAVCHRTELDDPDLEFRYCSKCDGDYEYCQDHLFTHKHVKK
ncbi:MAG: hypothetical protein PHD70_00510 [Anaerostipes sp.]|jgi:hypothetical protein|nr:hypothetical protein [Anaerostipes sp.]